MLKWCDEKNQITIYTFDYHLEVCLSAYLSSPSNSRLRKLLKYIPEDRQHFATNIDNLKSYINYNVNNFPDKKTNWIAILTYIDNWLGKYN